MISEAPDEETAVLLSWAGLLVPSVAGTAIWLVQERPTVSSVLLIAIGEVEGASLGYHYAGMHSQGRYGSGLRGLLLLSGLLLALDQDEPFGQHAMLAAGVVAAGGLAVYDASRLRHRLRTSSSRWRLEPAALRTSAGAEFALALTRDF